MTNKVHGQATGPSERETRLLQRKERPRPKLAAQPSRSTGPRGFIQHLRRYCGHVHRLVMGLGGFARLGSTPRCRPTVEVRGVTEDPPPRSHPNKRSPFAWPRSTASHSVPSCGYRDGQKRDQMMTNAGPGIPRDRVRRLSGWPEMQVRASRRSASAYSTGTGSHSASIPCPSPPYGTQPQPEAP